MRVAIIENNKVVNVIVADEGIECINGNIGDDYINGEFITPEKTSKPEIIITEIGSDDSNQILKTFNSGIICKVGSTISVKAEIRMNGSIVPLNDYFRMPLIASDGRERIVLANFINGKASISSTLNEGGFWSITEESINKGVPESNQFSFSGLSIDTYI